MKRQYVYVLCVGIVLVLVIGAYYANTLIALTARYRGSYGIRGIQVIAGLYHMIKHPFGVGGGIYTITLRQSAALMYGILCDSNYLGQFVVSNWEVNELLYGTTDVYACIIAGMMQQSLFWGALGTGYWLKKTYDYFHGKRNESKFIMISIRIFLACVIAMFFMTTSIYNQYMIFALLIVLGEHSQSFNNRGLVK